MPRTLWQRYQDFLEHARAWTGEQSEAAVVSAVRERRRQDPVAFAAWVEENGWGRAYVERHLLYLAGHPEGVRELLRRGYPLRRIPLKRVDPGALERALASDDWRAEVDALFGHARVPDWAARRVWLYPASPTLREREGLAEPVARALVAVASPPGGLVVDPMAGGGVVVRVARALGRRAWGGDLNPGSAEVERADVRDVVRHVGAEQADLLVLHPPTFGAWSASDGGRAALRGVPENEHYSGYLDFVAELLEHARPAVRPGGQVALIARPPRRGAVFLAPIELAFGERGLRLTAYHLAVSNDGGDDWHLYLATVESQEEA